MGKPVWITDRGSQSARADRPATLKKYYWKCSLCDAEYIYRHEAEECEKNHRRGQTGWFKCPLCGLFYQEDKIRCHIDAELPRCWESAGQTKEEWIRRHPDTYKLSMNPTSVEDLDKRLKG